MSSYEKTMKEHQQRYYHALWSIFWSLIKLGWMGWVTWRLLK